jgi:hypothetical protein
MLACQTKRGLETSYDKLHWYEKMYTLSKSVKFDELYKKY